jgi:hypothetical protein
MRARRELVRHWLDFLLGEVKLASNLPFRTEPCGSIELPIERPIAEILLLDMLEESLKTPGSGQRAGWARLEFGLSPDYWWVDVSEKRPSRAQPSSPLVKHAAAQVGYANGWGEAMRWHKALSRLGWDNGTRAKGTAPPQSGTDVTSKVWDA